MPAPQGSDLLVVGKVGAAYGVKGWVKLISFMDPADNILNYSHFVIAGTADNSSHDIEIDLSRSQGKGFVGHIKGCGDRSQTREYTGRELMLHKSELPNLQDEQYYWYQLQGLTVLTLENVNLGDVDHLLETGANDVLVVRPSPTSLDDSERLIPFIREQVVRDIDLQQRVIRVDWQPDY